MLTSNARAEQEVALFASQGDPVVRIPSMADTGGAEWPVLADGSQASSGEPPSRRFPLDLSSGGVLWDVETRSKGHHASPWFFRDKVPIHLPGAEETLEIRANWMAKPRRREGRNFLRLLEPSTAAASRPLPRSRRAARAAEVRLPAGKHSKGIKKARRTSPFVIFT